jgi:hypothetical protein
LAWDASDLLTTGELSVVSAPAGSSDFDGEGDVDGADFLAWQRGFGLTGPNYQSQGDANNDGSVDAADLTQWQAHFGGPPAAVAGQGVPEPGPAWLVGFYLMALILKIKR